MMIPTLTVSDFVAITNQTLEIAYPNIVIEGEVESFSVNQGKFVFFNIKDEQSSVGCFMMKFNLHIDITDGMMVRIKARPKLTQRGKFSLTVDTIQPIGEGSVKKSFDLLRARLDKEGLFAPERKRTLPWWPRRVAVVSSKQSAGYIDFMKIAESRIKGVDFTVCNTLVQGIDAPGAIVKAIDRCNKLPNPPEVVVIIRGGGSADDLAAFNDERVVRAIVASRAPVLVGVGHEIDVTLADLAADVRAATPTNAATILLPSVDDVIGSIKRSTDRVKPIFYQTLSNYRIQTASARSLSKAKILDYIDNKKILVESLGRVIQSLNPQIVLARGYAIVRGDPTTIGGEIDIETNQKYIKAKVISYEHKK